jgi:putative ABC transport system permease protein
MRFALPALGTALRALRRQPRDPLMCIVVLAVSTAALLTIAAIADAMLFRNPTARAPDQLTFIRSSLEGGVVSAPDFIDLDERITRLSGVFAYDRVIDVSLGFRDQVVTGRSQAVSGTFFPTLGVAALRGRLFTAADDREGTEPVVVLAARFAEEHALQLDDIVTLNQRPFRVVGILPPEYQPVVRDARPTLWIPLAHIGAYRASWLMANRGSQWLRLGGRLAPGTTHAEVEAELDVVAQQIRQENPQHNYGMRFSLASFPALRLTDDRTARTSLMLGGIVAALFILAFTNLAALTLLRLLKRRREVALRRAIGADNSHISGWLACETIIVLLLGFALGIALSFLQLGLLRLDPHLGRLVSGAGATLDLRVVAVIGGAVGIAGWVLWVVLQRIQKRDDVWTTLKEGPSAPRSQRLFLSLLAVQLGLAFLLLAMASSLLDELRKTLSRPLAIRSERAYLVDVDLRALGWFNDVPRSNAFHRTLQQAIAATPGVTGVGLTSRAPLTTPGWTNVVVDERDPALEPDQGIASFGFIGPGYFSTLGLPIEQGREISAHEIEQLQHVAVINRAMWRRYWPAESSPIGLAFRPWAGGQLTTIVGVVADRAADGTVESRPRIYLPYATSSSGTTRPVYVIAVDDPSPAMRQRLVDTIAAHWPQSGAPQPYSIEQHITEHWSEPLATVRTSVGVAVFALLVTGCGLYFISAYTAALTQRETAIRLALGARTIDLVRHHVARYRWAPLGGGLAGLALVVVAHPLLAALDGRIPAPDWRYGLFAGATLSLIVMLGLAAPLWSLRRLDVNRTLSAAN